MSALTPNPHSVTISGSAYEMIAFYYPGHNTAWDNVYQAPFFGNFWKTPVTIATLGSSGTFTNAESAFQSTKWWDASLPTKAEIDAAPAAKAQHLDDAFADLTRWWNRHHRSNPLTVDDFKGAAIRPLFEKCPDGGMAFSLRQRVQGDRRKNIYPLRHPDYNYAGFGNNDAAMASVLDAKFQDPTLRAGLLATNQAYLLEHNTTTGRDAYWSDNNDGTGRNHLGLALMDLRASLSQQPVPMYPGVADFTRNISYS